MPLQGWESVLYQLFLLSISSRAICGLLMVLFAAYQQLGVVLGFFINNEATKRYPGVDKQWMLTTLLQVVPTACWGFGTFLCSECPRWLLIRANEIKQQ
ncbi:hypothetical protein ETB97_003407 [Aspergillus alliaceus]|uniref:Major facilitator superfamily (MFS) profile domain-containing protein n=1 Tax=Petromyces alliaceus TaxID=209559 RepID=A0A8H6EBA9_PETAA|nr:hypothetical protein ETB97_003407 [Aspergillus burnettii]